MPNKPKKNNQHWAPDYRALALHEPNPNPRDKPMLIEISHQHVQYLCLKPFLHTILKLS